VRSALLSSCTRAHKLTPSLPPAAGSSWSRPLTRTSPRPTTTTADHRSHDVALIFDGNRVDYATQMLRSAAAYGGPRHALHFHLVAPPSVVPLVQPTLDELDIRATWYDYAHCDRLVAPVRPFANEAIHTSALCKVFLADLLVDVDRVLYLDTDATIVGTLDVCTQPLAPGALFGMALDLGDACQVRPERCWPLSLHFTPWDGLVCGNVPKHHWPPSFEADDAVCAQPGEPEPAQVNGGASSLSFSQLSLSPDRAQLTLASSTCRCHPHGALAHAPRRLHPQTPRLDRARLRPRRPPARDLGRARVPQRLHPRLPGRLCRHSLRVQLPVRRHTARGQVRRAARARRPPLVRPPLSLAPSLAPLADPALLHRSSNAAVETTDPYNRVFHHLRRNDSGPLPPLPALSSSSAFSPSGPVRVELNLECIGQPYDCAEASPAALPPRWGDPIYVLTRTARRPRFFAAARASVLAQSYPYVHHLVATDDPSSMSYLSGVAGAELVARRASARAFDPAEVCRACDHLNEPGRACGQAPDLGNPLRQPYLACYCASHYPMNELVNHLVRRAAALARAPGPGGHGLGPGWLVILDDDNVLSAPSALSDVMLDVAHADELVLFRSKLGRLTPSDEGMGRVPVERGDIDASNFMVHSGHAEEAMWDDRRCGECVVSLSLSGLERLSP